MEQQFIKSPMNYIGNKYRIINQLENLFPKKINKMVDLFCGGLDVSINTVASEHYANDINYHIIEIYKEFQKHSIDYILCHIDKTIEQRNLSKTNKQSYVEFRDYYNKTKNPLDLYVLMCYSFNYQFRFNSKHEYNNPFGKDRSSFNEIMRNNLKEMHQRLNGIIFTANPFQDFDYSVLHRDDFLYADPPYLISCGSYNDGKRGFTGWGMKEEKDLYDILNQLSDKGIKFALSNIIEHKGKTNKYLLEWYSKYDYNIYDINFNYSNSNYHTKNTNMNTREVLITNY